VLGAKAGEGSLAKSVSFEPSPVVIEEKAAGGEEAEQAEGSSSA